MGSLKREEVAAFSLANSYGLTMNNRNSLLFSYPKKGMYFFDHLDSTRINCVHTLNEGRKHRLLTRLHCILLPFFSWVPGIDRLNMRILSDHYNHVVLDQINRGKGLVILDTGIDIDLLRFIKKRDVKHRVFIFIWNNIDPKKAKLFSKYVRKENVYSYSEEQSKYYGFGYHNHVLLTSLKLKELPIKYDFYFLGSGKQREDMLEKFGDSLNKSGFKYLFEVWGKGDSHHKNLSFFADYKPYDDYLDKVSMSRCLVDFVTNKNLTFRTIESFSFGKKLISNNEALRKYDFFNENNILIIDPNDESFLPEVEEFLKKPIVKIEDRIIKRYDIYGLYDFFADLLREEDKNRLVP